MEPLNVATSKDPPVSPLVIGQKRPFASAFLSSPNDKMTIPVFGQSSLLFPFLGLASTSSSTSHPESKRSKIELQTPSATSIEDSSDADVDTFLESSNQNAVRSNSTNNRPLRFQNSLQNPTPDENYSPTLPAFNININPFTAYESVTKLTTFASSKKLALFDKLTEYIESNNVVSDDRRVELDRTEQALSYTNTPIFSSAVSIHVETNLPRDWPATEPIPQFGLIGLREYCRGDYEEQTEGYTLPSENLVFANVNVPWSMFLCGSQGAGKSHTLSCLLENALVKDNDAGQLSNPLAGMVFHYDTYTNALSTQLCEAAYLCSSGIPVTILVSPSNIWAMKRLYSNLPGLPPDSPKPKILPLYLAESSLDIEKILKLMAIDPTSDRTPLYMEIVMKTLREMAMEGSSSKGFTYSDFRRRLNSINFQPGQSVPLTLRLQLLESFLEPSATTRSTRPAPAKEDIWAFEAGTLTIIDLSDPFVNSNDACSLFTICLSNFLEGRNKCGRVIALDEAHKFLTRSGEAQVLTADLTSIIRQQRHTGTRVMIATQEPTLSPDLIDLCNATFVHRFLSPAWYETLKRHLAGANRHERAEQDSLFDTIVALKTGEALLFCPTALLHLDDSTGVKTARAMANGYIKIKVRKRLTIDGGKSVMASDLTNTAATETVDNDVPMHVVLAPPPQPQVNNRPRRQPTQPAPASRDVVNQAQSTPEIQDRLAQATREEARRLFANGAHGIGCINLPQLWRSVEGRVSMRENTIKQNPSYLSACEIAACDEMNERRMRRGWKPQHISKMQGRG